jgi:hypothetical protein
MTRTGLAVAVLMTAACIGAFNDEMETHYANTKIARTNGRFTRGWIPEIVPDDATNIWERTMCPPTRHGLALQRLPTWHPCVRKFAAKVDGPYSG